MVCLPIINMQSMHVNTEVMYIMRIKYFPDVVYEYICIWLIVKKLKYKIIRKT